MSDLDSGAWKADLPRVKFYCLLPGAPVPKRAERDANGSLPIRALRYCEASSAAAAFGWWLFPPMDFSLVWHEDRILWTYGDRPDWLKLEAAQFPHFAREFDRTAPPEMQGFSPPFLSALPELGHVQIWTGLFARTAPGWSLLSRAPANIAPSGPYLTYEGIVETDAWFGPVFANLRFIEANKPVRFSRSAPFVQVQPVPRPAYSDDAMNALSLVEGLEDFTAPDWADFYKTIVAPNRELRETPGNYAIAARRRRKGGCPYAQE